MNEMATFSSPSSQYELHKIAFDQENINSSPLRPRSTTHSGQKLKKPPTVTPKRFKKFFTPRTSSSTKNVRPSKSGRQLRDITRNGINRRRTGEVTDDFLPSDDIESTTRSAKRQKLCLDVQSSPPQSSPLKRVSFAGVPQIREDDDLPSPAFSDDECLPDLFRDLKPFPTPIRCVRRNGQSRRLLERSFGGFTATSQGGRRVDHVADYRSETANFVTTPDDVQQFVGSALPFCSASCNTNSLVAIGDEEGGIRLMDTSPESDFRDVHVNFQVHPNAIMDIAFSSDDFLLASASGDQTTRLVDMHTQQVVCVLSGHTSSVKRVRFNPREDRLITTSSRDGTVQVWDLRCSGNSAVQSLRASFEHQMDADGYTAPATRYSTAKLDVAIGHRFTSRAQFVDTSRKEPSITTFEHMPHGREHLIITASDANASLKVWDIRNSGRRNPVPLSSTPVPEHHRRDYGISSMVLSGDGARLYAVCRDATIYAYSANHLALGNVSEMSSKPGRQRMLKDPKEGLGPLYGFKHPSFRVGTFYIRAALRPAKDDQCEMLAVGSTDNTPILFPTDERHFPLKERVHEDNSDDDEDEEILPLPRMAAIRPTSSLPIHQNGTALVRAHTKEVTSLVWSHDGDLVSVSDDFTARCWRRDANRARELRLCGEGEGARWNSGWADVDGSWDDEDVDEVGVGSGGIVCEWNEAGAGGSPCRGDRQSTPPMMSKTRFGGSRMGGARRMLGGAPARTTRLTRAGGRFD